MSDPEIESSGIGVELRCERKAYPNSLHAVAWQHDYYNKIKSRTNTPVYLNSANLTTWDLEQLEHHKKIGAVHLGDKSGLSPEDWFDPGDDISESTNAPSTTPSDAPSDDEASELGEAPDWDEPDVSNSYT